MRRGLMLRDAHEGIHPAHRSLKKKKNNKMSHSTMEQRRLEGLEVLTRRWSESNNIGGKGEGTKEKIRRKGAHTSI